MSVNVQHISNVQAMLKLLDSVAKCSDRAVSELLQQMGSSFILCYFTVDESSAVWHCSYHVMTHITGKRNQKCFGID